MSRQIVTMLAIVATGGCREVFRSLEDVEGRIVGGTIVEPAHKYPFQVYFSAGGYSCAGSILDSRHVLTASHCLYNQDGARHDPAICQVWTGAHDRPEGRCGKDTGQRVGVEEFITRDDYNKETFENDLAILRLEDDIVLSDHAQPIQLPGPNTTSAQSTATVIGWGGVYPHDPDSHWYQQQKLSCQLLETRLSIVALTEEKCEEITFGDSETKICAFKEGTDSCQGDSGGPLFIEHEGVFTQLGIVSYGYGCATAYPGVYTRLERYTDWVQDVIALDTPVSSTMDSYRAAAHPACNQSGHVLVFLVLGLVRTFQWL
eukprot:GFUD01128542.1.p1 GENE.GFUD01128542.1~~GFUD01128542.1.p1  ORF type:complete len:335 (+),score=53.17 GFUD01128542.1:56-1006(+)